MALDFPQNPSLNQVYTEGNRTWTWNGRYWKATSTTIGYTGSQGATGASVRIVGSLADQSLLPIPYGGEIGDGYLVEDTGHLWLWDGAQWNDIGRLTGEVGPSGFTGSRGLGIIDTELVDDELIIIYDDSTQNNLGNIRGFQGSRGESSFFWGSEPPLNPEVGARWFYTTEGLLLVYTDDGDSQQWVEVAATGFLGQQGYTGSAGLSGVRIQTVTYPGQATAADTQGGETLGMVGGGFNAGIKVYVDSTECAATVVDQNNLTFTSPVKSANTYDVVVYNTDGSSGIKPQGIVYSGSPMWITANTLPAQDVDYPVSIILSATSNSAVTYFLQQGSSLPPGLSMSSSGVISGTVTGLSEDTTYTFTVVAIDAESQTTPRTFSLTIRQLLTIEYLVVAGGGGGGGRGGGGGGGGGLLSSTSLQIPRSLGLSVSVGGGGAGGASQGVLGTQGTQSYLRQSGSGTDFTSVGGGGGGTWSPSTIGTTGGSGGGNGKDATATAASGTTGQGNSGGSCSTNTACGAGGGGGAGAVGGQGTASEIGGAGGAGSSRNITGASVTYAGGGGGGVNANSPNNGAGGAGGGGRAAANNQAGESGTANLGGGGGGSALFTHLAGYAGGSGVVVVAYPDTYPAITTISAGLTYNQPTRSGYRVYRFTAGTGLLTF